MALQIASPRRLRFHLEAASKERIGRFGWKGQHASLESFSADAYLNEMGITAPLFPEENTSNGRFVARG